MSNDSTAVTGASIQRTYIAHPGNEISDALLESCANLFSGNYGIWGQNPTGAKFPKPGSRVKLSVQRLREQCVADPNNTVLVVCYLNKQGSQNPSAQELVGHAFATVWDYDGGRVGWVTQLVVSSSMRRKYIATCLIQQLKSSPIFQGVTTIGLASSHPSSCHALSKYTDISIHSMDLTFCQRNAKAILDRSPVPYVKNMKLHGSLFEDKCTTGAVSCVFTNFYLDHKEPQEVLAVYKNGRGWVLGELPAGHEFLIILPANGFTPL